MEELRNKKRRINTVDKKINELKSLKEVSLALKNQYYRDYFEVKRDDATLLNDLPPYEWLDEKWRRNHHPLENYSSMNVLKIGEYINELLKGEGINSKVKLVISRIRHEYYHDGGSDGYSIEDVPYMMIGPSPMPLRPFNEYYEYYSKDNIRIKLDNYKFKKDKRYNIEGTVIDYRDTKECFYSPYEKLVGPREYDRYSSNKNELTFDNLGHENVRELILSIAAYQKDNDIIELSDEELDKVFTKIYKKR